MATVFLPGYALVLDAAGDAQDWIPVTFRVVLPGDGTRISYTLDSGLSAVVDVLPLALDADSTNLLRRNADGSILEDVAFLTLGAPGYDADIVALRSEIFRDEFFVRLGGDPLPDDLSDLAELFLATDEPLTAIDGGPFRPGRSIDLGALPGAEVTQDDRIVLNGVPAARGARDDVISTGRGRDVVASADGDDRVALGAGDDVGFGGRGNDVLIGGAGGDRLVGGAGGDRLRGGGGNDRLDGGGGDDRLDGGGGRDALRGGGGDDVLRGRSGRDDLDGGGGRDQLEGARGADDLSGGRGRDVLDGGGGGDAIAGGGGADTLLGGDGRDRLSGNAGDDILLGGAGGDVLRGGDGNDFLVGGGGDDRLIGGRGDDVFAFEGGDERIADFALRRGVDSVTIFYDDLFGIPSGRFEDDVRPEVLDALRDAAEMRGGDLAFDFGRGGSLTYEGLDMGDLDRVLNEANLSLLSTF